MRVKLRRPTHAAIVAYAALFLALSGTAYAATGGTLILGNPNSANKTTSLTNTGSGAALRLVTHQGSTPPLAVSNGTKIANLNADMVDGVRASSLQPKLPSRLSFAQLKLINGWEGNCFNSGAPGIALDPSGVVHLRGGICTASASNTSFLPFTIPAKFRPARDEWLTVNECSVTTARMEIDPNGMVRVEQDPNASPGATPQCFTSLAGVTYTLPY
jgi:hypothetical protein